MKPLHGGCEGRDARFTLSRSQRLTRSEDIRDTFDQRQSYVGRLMVLWVRRGEGAALRLATVSSRKVGGAVDRTKARRRLREAWRRNRYRLTASVDVVLVARRSLVSAPAERVEAELMYLCGKAGLLG